MIIMRRTALVVLLLLAAAMIGPAGSGLAQTGQPAVAQPSVRADFNQDGYADLAIGAPGEDVGTTVDAGAVSVLYGSASGLSGRDTQLFTQVGGYIEHDDQFGGAVASGDFNHDGYADLAVGTPGESLSPRSTGGGGVINVLYGSAAGLSTRGAQLFTQVGSAGEPGDQFGEAMVAGDFNHDSFADLAVSAPGEDQNSGGVSVLYGSAGGLARTGGRFFTQVGGAVEAGDSFGSALAAGDLNHDGFADLAAGAPGEAVGAVRAAGAVSVLYGSAGGLTSSGGRLFTQVGGAVELEDFFGRALAAGDFNQDGFADLAAGAPSETVGTRYAAGAVSVLYGAAGGLTTSGGRLFTQVGGAVEGLDWFGEALASGDFNRDGFADLAAGAPLETVGTVELAGAVSVLYGSAGGLTATGGRLFTEAGDIPQAYDRFGEAATSGDFNQDGFADLAVGAPFERFSSRIDCGAASILYGAAGGLTAGGGQLFYQGDFGGPGTPETLDQFGEAVTASG
jgi:hypothetical protein